MTRRKLDMNPSKKGSYHIILSATNNASQQPVAPTTDLINCIANIALAQDANQFAALQAKQGNDFDINLKSTNGEGVFHLLMKNINEQTLSAILFLLERGASFGIKNNVQQTPFHLLAIHGTSSIVLKFWQSTEIWNFLRNVQEQFDTTDIYGKTFLHYFMMKPGDKYVSAILQQYYRHRPVDIKDIEGNTPLHLAVQRGNISGIEFYLSKTNEEYINAQELFVITNNEGQTPGDLARLKDDVVNARKLYRREFNYSPFHDYLRAWFEKQKKLLHPAETVANYQQTITARLEQLAKTIIIAPSEIDVDITKILQSLNMESRTTDKGIEIQLEDAKMASLNLKDRRKIYKLTPIGRLEWLLRDSIISSLSSFAQDINSRVDEMKKEYDDFYNRRYKAYEERRQDFSDGDEGYDYDGPIVPQPPTYTFNRKIETERLQAEIEEINWEDLKAILAYVPVEDGLMGQMLYDDFIGMDMAEDLIEHLNKSALEINPVLLSSLILNLDFQFSDMDIIRDGFLIEAIKENFAVEFANSLCKTHAKQLALDFIETCCRSSELLQDIRLYNQAAQNKKPLTLQQVWMRMQPCLMQYLAEKTKLSSTLRRSLSTEFTKITQKKTYVELSKKTNNLIKIFPTDESRTFYYMNGAGSKLTLDLKPLFKTLQTIAEATHQIIVKYSKNPEDGKKTNVITAYLMLVVRANDSFGKEQQKFIRIPLVLNPEKRLLSKDIADGIFASEHEFHSSVAEDRQKGANIAHREPNIDVVSAGEIAKQKMLRLLSCLNIPTTEKQQFIDSLQKAQVDKPLQLDYESQAPVQQSTLFNHSERVIFRALKMPSNIKRIVNYLYDECRQNFEIKGYSSYQVEAGCLILYSYPNSVCDECSLGVLALQHSEQDGFVHLLTQTLQNFCPSSTSSSVHSPLPLFTVSTEAKDSELGFPLTTIVASEKIFPSDSYASILNTYPTAKMDYFVDGSPGFFSTPGISVSSSAPSHFYEFVETDLSNIPPSIPYGGSVTMSGSKEVKLRAQNISCADAEIAAVITEYDAELPQNRPSLGL